jgi:acetyl esterase/lipase
MLLLHTIETFVPHWESIMSKQLVFLTLVLSFLIAPVADADVAITPDVVYGHKFGLALTFDVFTPTENSNGTGVLFMVSGGWYSNWSPPEQIQQMFRPLTDAGYTVFAVRHGSSPKFSIPEAVEDVRRSVRFIRANAEKFKVDPNRLGVFGISAGGHLSLMLGTAADEGDQNATDPVLKNSSRVQAVAAWVAPTDLQIMVRPATDRLPAYDRFPALDLDLVSAKACSPLVLVTPDDAPTLLLAGDRDDLVPILHSELIQAAFEKQNVLSKFVVLKGAGHGFGGEHLAQATSEMVSWFNQNLANPANAAEGKGR